MTKSGALEKRRCDEKKPDVFQPWRDQGRSFRATPLKKSWDLKGERFHAGPILYRLEVQEQERTGDRTGGGGSKPTERKRGSRGGGMQGLAT